MENWHLLKTKDMYDENVLGEDAVVKNSNGGVVWLVWFGFAFIGFLTQGLF